MEPENRDHEATGTWDPEERESWDPEEQESWDPEEQESWDPEERETWDPEEQETWDPEEQETWNPEDSESRDSEEHETAVPEDGEDAETPVPENGEDAETAVSEDGEEDAETETLAGSDGLGRAENASPDADAGDLDGPPIPPEGSPASGRTPPSATGRGGHGQAGTKAGGGSEVVGVNAVTEALEARGDSLRRLCVSSSRRPSAAVKLLIAKATALGAPLRRVPPSYFARFAPAAHQGVCAVFDELAPLDLDDFLESLPREGPSLVLALDHIEDPGNLGALVRSAWAFGAHGAVAPRDRSAGITPAAAKAAAGGLEKVPLARAVNLPAALRLLQKRGYWVVGAEASGDADLATFEFPERTALVLGGEGRGLGRLVSSVADFLVRIPLSGGAESLNVSAAGAVFMYAYRSRFPLNR
jgi:23S rRNA (guanosine2251-2'-O)-methyltransferase